MDSPDTDFTYFQSCAESIGHRACLETDFTSIQKGIANTSTLSTSNQDPVKNIINPGVSRSMFLEEKRNGRTQALC